jgi:hypothetical protein
MGIDVDQANGGCCGLAGSWGFEGGKYEISMNCGEQGLLPAARNAPGDAVIVANGFSCKTQLEQSDVGRRALHVGQVMKLARDRGPTGWTRGKPEEAYSAQRPAAPASVTRRRFALLAVIGATVGAVAVAGLRCG